MDQRTFIAGRIDVQMRRHLGMPVDTHRAVADARYSRDMLLVCDAMTDTEMPHLAQQFRVAEALHDSARRAMSPRPNARLAASTPPPREPANPAQRPVTFGRAR
jgi:hypothetical protein